VLRPRIVVSLVLSAASIAGAPECQLPNLCGRDAIPSEACVQLNSPPTARITVNQSSAIDTSLQGRFVATAFDQDGDDVYFEWDFESDGVVDQAVSKVNDSTQPLTSEVPYSYARPGIKTVTLRVTDFPGLGGGEGSTTTSVTFRVYSPDEYREDQRPVASFTFAPTDAGKRETLQFDASASFDPDFEQPIQRYTWNFGGTEVVENDPFTSFQFPAAGQYAVTLRVTSNPFLTGFGEQTQTVTIAEEAPPRARLDVDNTTPLVGQLVRLDASRTTDADNDIEGYQFDPEGDGSYGPSQTEPTFDHRYTRNGLYRATVKVTDGGGRIGLAQVMVQVEGGEGTGPTSPERLRQKVAPPSPVPFSAKIGERAFTISLLGAKRTKVRAQKALRVFAKARWRAALKVKTDPKKGTLRANGLVLATTKGRRPRQLCLRLTASAKRGEPVTGTLRILGGTGPGATLGGRLDFRAAREKDGTVKAVGEARPVEAERRALPKRCAGL
jgi:PKD domain